MHSVENILFGTDWQPKNYASLLAWRPFFEDVFVGNWGGNSKGVEKESCLNPGWSIGMNGWWDEWAALVAVAVVAKVAPNEWPRLWRLLWSPLLLPKLLPPRPKGPPIPGPTSFFDTQTR